MALNENLSVQAHSFHIRDVRIAVPDPRQVLEQDEGHQGENHHGHEDEEEVRHGEQGAEGRRLQRRAAVRSCHVHALVRGPDALGERVKRSSRRVVRWADEMSMPGEFPLREMSREEVSTGNDQGNDMKELEKEMEEYKRTIKDINPNSIGGFRVL